MHMFGKKWPICNINGLICIFNGHEPSETVQKRLWQKPLIIR